MHRRWHTVSTAVVLLCWAAVTLAQMGSNSLLEPPQKQVQGTGDWKKLRPHEKQALAPLASQWGTLTETQRGKWLAIAQQFAHLTAQEQQIMQDRMKSWVALSPTQRSRARLNFNLVQDIPKEEKKSRWDEYQSLSESEKRKLSSGALAPARTAAPGRRPVAPERLVQPPLRTMPPQALPHRQPIDGKTLLPMPAPALAASAASSEPLVSPSDLPAQTPLKSQDDE